MKNKHTALPNKADSDSSLPGASPAAVEVARFIYHRCRNDLSTVADLLNFRAPFEKDPISLAKSMEGRIAALCMAYNHPTVHAGKDLTLQSMACDIVERALYKQTANKVLISDLPPLKINLRLASPIGLWLYEILSNATTHGNGAKGDKAVAIKGEMSGNSLIISISDQGPGLPAGFDLERDAKAGLKVAQAVAGYDLKAKMELIPAAPGLCVRLEAPLDEIGRLNNM